MNKGMVSDISCDVCRDLMPLVLDDVASEDSAALVRQHTAHCEECREIFTGEQAREASGAAPDDVKVLKKLRARVLLRSALLVLAGMLAAAWLSYSLYRMWVMPLLGAAAYLLLRRKWWIVPAGVGVLKFAGQVMVILPWVGQEEAQWDYILVNILYHPLTYAWEWVFPILLGVAVAALLRFALGGLDWKRLLGRGKKGKEGGPDAR